MRNIFIGLVLFLSSMLFAQAATIEGIYQCKGHTPLLRENYRGIMKIKKNGEVYSLSTKYKGRSSAMGTGLLLENKKTLAVIYKDSEDPIRTGVEAYNILSDGKELDSIWVQFGANKTGSAKCYKSE